MKCILFFLFAFILWFDNNAQTVQKDATTYDLVYMKDGRVLKGEIVIFQETDGDITFKDLQGNTYSITRKEYDFFKQNVMYVIKDNDTVVILNRKIKEMEVSLGVEPFTYLRVNTERYGSRNFLIPVSASFTISKYFNRVHNIGIGASLGLVTSTEIKAYLEPNITYKYQYDGYKTNFYPTIIAQATYSNVSALLFAIEKSGINGTFLNHKLSGYGISIGHGISFMVANKKSISIEALINRNFTNYTTFAGKSPSTVHTPSQVESFSTIKLRAIVNM